MYNRYIRNDRGTYTRITEDDGMPRRPSSAPAPPQSPPEPSELPPPEMSGRPPEPPPPDAPHKPPLPPDASHRPPPPEMSHRPPPQPPIHDGLNGFLRHLNLENVDTGDLLLLCLLFLLYREGADEELLVALGLLLIL